MGLGKKLVLVVEAVTIIVAALIGVSSYVVLRNALVSRTNAQLESISVLKEGSINRFIEEVTSEMEYLTIDNETRSEITKYIEFGKENDKELVLESFLDIVNEKDILHSIYLINLDGIVVASTNKDDEGKIKSNEQFFLNAREKTYIQDFYFDTGINQSTMLVTTPVTQADGKVVGILAGRLNTNEISKLMVERSGLGKTGETYLINSSNVTVTELFKEPGVALKKTIFSSQISDCLSAKTSFGSGFDYHNDLMLGYWRWIPEINSCLVTQIDKSEALQIIWQTVGVLAAIIVAVAIIVGILGILVSRSVVKPIQKLRDVAIKIKEGNFDVISDVKSNDEIGEMSVVFSDMSKRLKELYENLENKVKERTREIGLKLSLIEEQNKSLDQNKVAMLNLLEDSKALEESLKNERDQSSAIISSMGESLLVADKDFKVVLINKKAQELLEVTEDEVLGKSWSETVTTIKDGKDVPTSERSLAMVMKTKKPIVTKMDDNHFYKTHTGKIFSVASITAPLMSEDGKTITGAVKVFRDATKEKEEKSLIEKEVKLRTNELNEEKAKLTSAISSLPRAFAIIDPAGQIATTNGQFENVFGKQKEKWSVELIDRLLEGKLKLQDSMKDVLSKNKIFDNDDIEFGNKFIGIYMAPILGSDKKLIGAILTIKDVTEDKIRERSKDEFFSIASHELRTPLTAIRGNTSMILDYYKDAVKDPEVKTMITDMHDASLRLIGIVNDFLDLSRLEQKRMEYKISNIKLSEIVASITKDLEATVKEKNIKLESTVEDKIVVNADPDKLKQILFNIIGNSIKFTEKGGVTISTVIENSFVKVKIADTGKGIPAANQSLLFRKFQQAGESTITRDGAKGTGLGLYISKLMVEGMGGTIALESSVEGKGSVFTFTLPVAKVK